MTDVPATPATPATPAFPDIPTIPNTAFVSTYVPRRCGIATFTQSLIAGLWTGGAPATRTRVVALDRGDGLTYPAEVDRVLPAGDRTAYRRVAGALVASGVEVVSLQHEYGIFGGRSGRHVLDLLDELPVPVLTTLHTILANPTPTQEAILRAIAARSARLVAMTERGRAILVERYDVDPARIVVIPHGVPSFDPDRDAAKAALGLTGRKVVLSFGLLGPHKNVDLVMEALARVVDRVPDALFAVVGATHPEIQRRHGETYRESLVARAAQLGLDGHTRFVNRYLDDAEVANWLAAADVFVTPYRDAQQITSGTLAYALSAGSAVISTPYEHARELLGRDRGLLVPFDDAAALAGALELTLADDAVRTSLGERARAFARSMVWPAVAARYAWEFRAAVADSRMERPFVRVATVDEPQRGPVAARVAIRTPMAIPIAPAGRGSRSRVRGLDMASGNAEVSARGR